MTRFRQALAVLFFLAPVVFRAQDQFFDSNGVRIRYIDRRSGSPIVLIHGFSGDIERGWVETGVLENLAKDHRVIAFDLRGHGKSDKPHETKAYGAEMSQDAVRLLDHLKIARANIVGHSLGGQVVAKLLTTNPDRFLTATLVGSGGRRNWTAENQRAAEAAAAEFETGIPFRSIIMRNWPTDQGPPTEEAIRKVSQEAMEGNDPLAMAAILRSGPGLAVTDAELASVRVPTLAIVGSADRSLTSVNDLKKVMPSLKIYVVEGATHAHERGVVRRPEFLTALRAWMK